jgi:uncharacterized surface protein with fasciclin (FAS1) repeats
MKDILETLTVEGSFATLLRLMEKAGLLEGLREPGPFTLFAPDDTAFTRVNLDENDSDRLKAVFTYHLVEGKVSAAGIAGEEHLLTVAAKSLTVHLDEGVHVVDNARLVRTDIECSNGVIHIIDNVFLPQFSGWYCGGCC